MERAETQGAELEGGRIELRSVQAELAELKEASSKYREDILMEISQLQARAEDAERKLAGVPEEIVQPRLRLWLSSNRSKGRASMTVSAYSFTMSGGNTRNGTYPFSGRRLGRWSPSSMHLRRPL